MSEFTGLLTIGGNEADLSSALNLEGVFNSRLSFPR